jgi:hypothetical protein
MLITYNINKKSKMDNRCTILEHIYDNMKRDQITDNDDTSYFKNSEQRWDPFHHKFPTRTQNKKLKFHLCIGISMCSLSHDMPKFERPERDMRKYNVVLKLSFSLRINELLLVLIQKSAVNRQIYFHIYFLFKRACITGST